MMKILIVEDSAAMRRMMRTLLAPISTEIIECGDGREALAAYAAHRPDVVLMDIEMGEVDGISATKGILASFPEARVIIVTNYDDVSFLEAAQTAGACEYVLKENLFNLKRLLTSHHTKSLDDSPQ